MCGSALRAPARAELPPQHHEWHYHRMALICDVFLNLLPPVSPIVEEITVVPGVEHRLHEQPDDLEVTHVAEAPVGGVNASANDPEPAVRNFFAQQIVFCVQCPLVKAAQAVKRSLL